MLSISRDQYHQGTENAVSMPWIMSARLTELLEKIAAVEERACLIPPAAAWAIWSFCCVLLSAWTDCLTTVSSFVFLIHESFSGWLSSLNVCGDINYIYASAFLSLSWFAMQLLHVHCWQQENVVQVINSMVNYDRTGQTVYCKCFTEYMKIFLKCLFQLLV